MTQITGTTEDYFGSQGDGVYVYEGKPYYLESILPQETFSAQKGEIGFEHVTVLTPSPYRQKPACTIAETCGGCSFQHMNADFYQQMKKDMFLKSFQKLIPDIALAQAFFCQSNTRRRTTISFYKDAGRFVWGYKQKKSNKIIQPEYCTILTPHLAGVVQKLSPLLEPFVPVGVQGKLLYLDASNGIDMVMRGIPALSDKKRTSLLNILQTIPEIIRFSWDGEMFYQTEKPYLHMGDTPVAASADMFFQASQQGQDFLTQLVLSHMPVMSKPLKAKKPLKIADLFAGAGTFSLPLSALGQVDAYDNAGQAVNALKDVMAKTQKNERLKAFPRDLFRDPLSIFELRGYDVVVLDPPRQGAAKQVALVAQAKIKKIIMVFCDVQTALQDTALLLKAGYQLTSLAMVDQFTYTPHMEGVAVFEVA
jgi:23S rRNA (uracil1939-C5)-methyltransferase